MELSLLGLGEFSLFPGFPSPLDPQHPTDTHRVKQVNGFWRERSECISPGKVLRGFAAMKIACLPLLNLFSHLAYYYSPGHTLQVTAPHFLNFTFGPNPTAKKAECLGQSGVLGSGAIVFIGKALLTWHLPPWREFFGEAYKTHHSMYCSVVEKRSSTSSLSASSMKALGRNFYSSRISQMFGSSKTCASPR